MKLNKNLNLLLVSASICLSGQANAALTKAGEPISNTVTFSYTSAGSTVNTDATETFAVDQKVDMDLSGATLTKTAEIGKPAQFKFTLSNTGNKDQDFKFTVVNLGVDEYINNAASPTTGDQDNAQYASYKFYSAEQADVESPISGQELDLYNVKAQTLGGAELVDNFVDIWAIVTLPTTGEDDGDFAGFFVNATAWTGTSGSGNKLPQDITTDKNTTDNLDNTYVIWAEGVSNDSIVHNGEITIRAGVQIQSQDFGDPTDPTDPKLPKLAVQVINDPVCDYTYYQANSVVQDSDFTGGCPLGSPASYKPRALPGALVEFTFTATNAGSITAPDVTFVETLTEDYVVDSLTKVSAKNDTTDLSAANFTLTVSGTGTPATDIDTVTANFGDLLKDKAVTVVYRAILK